MAITWEEIREGTALPRLEKRPGVTQLVKYAAGSGDFNPLHHDYGFPQAKQIGSIIVHGRFKYAALGELVSNWLGHRGRIRKISCQFRGMDMIPKLLELFEAHPLFPKTEKVRIDVLRRFGHYSTESNGHLSEYVPTRSASRR